MSHAETNSPWCLECHQADPDGVGCVSCHGPTARLCADCHQFDLPVDLGGPSSGVAAQDTVAEWGRSTAKTRGEGCTDCHDPHRVRGGRDASLLRETLQVRVVRSATGVVATVTADGAGHAVPTGDPFRRLRLVVCADLACTVPRGEAWLQRRLERAPDRSWVVSTDTRIPPPTTGRTAWRTLEVPVQGARSWRLYYHLADPRHEALLVDDAVRLIESGLVEEP